MLRQAGVDWLASLPDRTAENRAAEETAERLRSETGAIDWAQALRKRYPHLLAAAAPKIIEQIGQMDAAGVGYLIQEIDADGADGALEHWDCSSCPARQAEGDTLSREAGVCRHPFLTLYRGVIVRLEHGPCHETAKRVREIEIMRHLLRVGVSQRFRAACLEDFSTETPLRRAAAEASRAWVTTLTGRRRDGAGGILLAGGTGRGKTYLAAASVRALLTAGVTHEDLAWVTVSEALEARRRGFSADSERGRQAEERWERATRARVAVLDDLGAEKPSEWTVEQVFVLVNARYDAERPTLITTNCTAAELAERLGERTVSRIQEMTACYPLDGPDRRRGVV